MDHYIYLPDDAIQAPKLLGEAVANLAAIIGMSPAVGIFSQLGDEAFVAWLFACFGLKAGAADAFVQARLSRRWARLPCSFWSERDPSAGPPTILEESHDPELRGQPIVVRANGLDVVIEVAWDILKSAEGGGVPTKPEVEDVAKSIVSRANPVSEDALKDWFRNVRVPSVGDGRIPNWEACYEAAKQAFSGQWVTRDRLQAVRRLSVPDAWNKPGPRG